MLLYLLAPYIFALLTLAGYAAIAVLTLLPCLVLRPAARLATLQRAKPVLQWLFLLLTIPSFCAFPIFWDYDRYLFNDILPMITAVHEACLVAVITLVFTLRKPLPAPILKFGPISSIAVSILVSVTLWQVRLQLKKPDLDRIPPIEWDSSVSKADAARMTEELQEAQKNGFKGERVYGGYEQHMTSDGHFSAPEPIRSP